MNHPSLPRGMRLVSRIDFTRSRRDMRALAILSFVSLVVMIPLGFLRQDLHMALMALWTRWWLAPCCIGLCVLYIPLHELVHGALMYLLSGVKPRYGIRLPYAYAGSTACFDRNSHMLIALAPLVVWGCVLLALELLLPRWWFWTLYIVQISNVSGSMGDVYTVWKLSKMPSDILVRDTGTLMTVYRPSMESGTDK